MNNSSSIEADKEVARFLTDLGPKPYSYEDLQNYTSKFSQLIGEGGYGMVYKGQIPGGVHIAVKILAKKDVVEETFMAEVRTMGTAYHRNLVKLYGYCFEGDTKALVYEYMENGSLDKILYDSHVGSTIKWEKLYGIAIETAKGIDYLHDGCEERIIHYDIKAGNVLLDQNLTPKITDFGMAKFLKRDVSRVPLSRIRGTAGYNALETWIPSSHVTCKCDVYSYGMMLFEVLGKRNNGGCENWLPQIVWDKYNNGQLAQLIKDCGIRDEKDCKNAEILSMVALWCTQYRPDRRPSMSDVVLMLQKKIPVGTPPYPFDFRQIPEVISEVLPTIDERHSLDFSLLPPTTEVIPVTCLDFGIVNPPMLPPPPPPRELHLKGSVTIDDRDSTTTSMGSSLINLDLNMHSFRPPNDGTPRKELEFNFIGMERKAATKNEAGVLVEELHRMNAENKKLSEMLVMICENYSTLQNHMMELTGKIPPKAVAPLKKRKADSEDNSNLHRVDGSMESSSSDEDSS